MKAKSITACLTLIIVLFSGLKLVSAQDNDRILNISPNIGLSVETPFYNNSSFVKPETIIPENDPRVITNNYETQAPFQQDWNDPDIRIDTALVATIGFRQVQIKFGPDFNLYAVVNKRSVTGQYTGRITIYKSSNGGLSWGFVSNIQSNSNYFGQFSFTVENSTSSIEDSTRIVVFFTIASGSNLFNAGMNFYSVRSNGSAPIVKAVITPTSGNKFFNPSVVSNGAYETANTQFGAIVGEYDNSTELSTSLRFVKTTDWGATFTSITLTDPGYPTFSDYFPSADFKLGSTDSVYIAVERRSTNDTLVRLIATPWEPTAAASTYFITTSPQNHEKPYLSILQTDANDNSTRKMMISCVRDLGNPVYHYSTDAGATWLMNEPLGEATQKDIRYVACSSDPDTTGGGYFIVALQDANFSTSDSVTIQRGVLGNMGPVLTKRNSNAPTGFIGPWVAIYKYTPMGGSLEKRSAFVYSGSGPRSMYYDQENLPTGISNNNGNATDYRLSQNYPNPFNPATKIDFSILKSSNVKLIVYDMLGRQVTTLVNKFLASGSYTVDFDGANLTSGVYFYRIDVENNFSDIKKMILVK